jgi:hypothetical protein
LNCSREPGSALLLYFVGQLKIATDREGRQF